MTYLVAYCNNWIGFHVVNELLDNGFAVDGMLDEKGNEDLSMFFGRNSSFTFVQTSGRKKYDAKIIIDDHHVKWNTNKREITINTPLLFGEWMPMNEKGLYKNNENILFDSELFRSKAIYVKDFTKGLIQWLQTPYLPQTLEVRSAKEKNNKDVKLENAIYIRDNVPISNKVKLVQDHYNRNKERYTIP